MLLDALYIALIIAVTLNLESYVYVLFAMWQVGTFGRQSDYHKASELPVTVLIPIHGLDIGLYQNLRSICLKYYPEYQII